MSRRSGHRAPWPVQILAIALTLTLALPFLSPFTGDGDRARAATIRSVTPGGLDTGDCSINPCATIQYAVNQSAAGATINVDAGTYAELVTVNKSLTLRGA